MSCARGSRKDARKRRRLAETLSTNGAVTGEADGSGNDGNSGYEVENHNSGSRGDGTSTYQSVTLTSPRKAAPAAARFSDVKDQRK